MVTIQNKELRADFSERGAENTALIDLATGRNVLWTGDAQYWDGHSPLLFPITGGLWNGVSRVGTQTWRIPKHGFVAGRTWRVERQEADAVTFVYESTAEDATLFPWPFRLTASYRLAGRCLKAEVKAENLGSTTMYFQLGGHPGITMPDFDASQPDAVDGYLKLEGRVESLLRAGEQGCIEVDNTAPIAAPEEARLRRFPVPLTSDGLVPVCVPTFANEALIFDRQVSAVTVLDRQRRPLATVRSTAPVWLFWSPQGEHAPFVCCEPWYGLPDLQQFEGDISRRAFIQSAEPGQTWTGGYEVEI